MSVKAGDSISIPCLYHQRYLNHVKYLCKGYYFRDCSYAAKTNQQSSEKFLISDDKNQKIFTVTIKNVTNEDKDFWCAVEINGGRDVSAHFLLSVTQSKIQISNNLILFSDLQLNTVFVTVVSQIQVGHTGEFVSLKGVSSLYVDHQEVTGFIREQVTITCYCQNSGEAKWCRVGGPCVGESQGSINGIIVVLDRSLSSGLRVTMSQLKMEDSGWYWCLKGDFQMPVHLSVRERSTTSKFYLFKIAK